MKNTFHLISGIAMAACLLASTSAIAQPMSSADFSAAKTRIKGDHQVEKKACNALSGNAKDVCVAGAKGKEDTALAELDHRYKPTRKSQYNLSVAKAEALYDLAKEKCDDLSGNSKDVCVEEAKAALAAGKADAKVQMKTAAANATATEKAVDAKTEANNENKEVRADAAAEKRAAQLKVAEEKCDALASTAKDNCLSSAKAHFGKL